MGLLGQPAYGFYRYTLSNVAQGSTRLWWSVGFEYMYTCHALHLIRKEYEHLLTWRQDWLAHGVADTPAQPRYSIVVERLPPELRSDTALRAYVVSTRCHHVARRARGHRRAPRSVRSRFFCIFSPARCECDTV